MIEKIIYIFSGIFLILATFFAYLAIRIRKKIQSDNWSKNQWIQEQLKRAQAQLDSQNEEEVLTGSQIIYALGDRKNLSSLVEAQSRWHGEPRVARQLSVVYEKLASL